jgi:hypothetical protein
MEIKKKRSQQCSSFREDFFQQKLFTTKVARCAHAWPFSNKIR